MAGIDLSLDRLNQLIPHLSTPYTIPTIHVAGTNGKGSVSALLASILRSATPPLRVGRFTSPHLVDVHDAIALNNEPVQFDIYTAARQEIDVLDRDHATKLTNFERFTLTALLIFARAGLDIAVVEVGLGGRLDATNAIPTSAILLSALTAVDLDHQAFLGPTVRDIAREKAGIARKGRVFVLGHQPAGEQVEEVVNSVVHDAGGEVFSAIPAESLASPGTISLCPGSFTPPPPQNVIIRLPSLSEITASLPLPGAHQISNLSVATTVIHLLLTHPSCAGFASSTNLSTRLTPETIGRGIANTRWPGRLSFHTFSTAKVPVIVDGAHNPASARALGAYITRLISLLAPGKRTIRLVYILALSHSPQKTPLQTLSELLPPTASDADVTIKLSAALLSFTPPEDMPWVKSVPPNELASVVKQLLPTLDGTDIWVSDVERQENPLKHALDWAAGKIQGDGDGEGLIVLAGSLYLVADFYRLVGKDE